MDDVNTQNNVFDTYAREVRREAGFRFGIGIRVEEMGYEYPAHSPERKLCFEMAKEIKERAEQMLEGVRP